MDKKYSVIYIMLLDEYERTKKNIEYHEQKIREYPKGSLKIMRNKYCYLSYRKNGVSVSKYIAKTDDVDVIQKIKEQIEERKYYERMLKKYKAEEKEIEAYLKTGERFYGKSNNHAGK